MARLAKRQKAIREKCLPGKTYTLEAAIKLLKEIPPAKFDETVDVAFNLGIDPRKSDQNVRGSVVLPKGTGRKVRVAVFTAAANQEIAKQAGADLVGLEDIAEQVKAGKIEFDVLLATPDAMRVIGQLGQILGPRGLMPNPKDGTVTTDIAGAVRNVKMGQARYRADKAGIIHCTIGKASFAPADLKENFEAVLAALKKAKPNTAKGIYFKKITLSTTMGPGLVIDAASVVG